MTTGLALLASSVLAAAGSTGEAASVTFDGAEGQSTQDFRLNEYLSNINNDLCVSKISNSHPGGAICYFVGAGGARIGVPSGATVDVEKPQKLNVGYCYTLKQST
ncbi:MAG: hypothetical protein Q9206_002475 [Seirophora lacunosa]